MSWDGTGYGGHGGTALVPDTQWLFAEGSQGFFDTYVLIANDNAAPVDATVRFFLEGGGVVNRPLTLEPKSRVTIYAGDLPALVNGVVWNRGHYLGAADHGGARHVLPAHGRTPVRRRPRSGRREPCQQALVPRGRRHRSVLRVLRPPEQSWRDRRAHDAHIPPAERRDRDASDRRAGHGPHDDQRRDRRRAPRQHTGLDDHHRRSRHRRRAIDYWPDISLGWREAHNSIGTVDPALRWGVSDIRVGGARAAQTYVLLANPNPAPAEVRVRLLRSGAAPIVQTYTLQPTSRTNIFAADLAGADGTYSMDVQVLNYQPIVVEKALYWNAGADVWAAGTGVVATPLPPR